jgi:gliding motility-associated-like protein
MKRNLLIVILLCVFSKTYSQSCTLNVDITASSPAICSGNSVTLTATASSGTPAYTYAWNTGETTVSIIVNKEGTYTVTVSDKTAGCKPVVRSITVSAAPTPTAPTAASTSTCPNGTATLRATAPGGAYQWYDAPTAGTLLTSGDTYTTPPLTSTTTYYVQTSSGQCTSARTAVTVSIVSSLAVSGASVCSGNVATLSASGATTYQWFDAATGGNQVGSGSTYTTPPLSATTTYYVVGSGNGCTSGRTGVTATVTPTPQPPTAPGTSVCYGSTASLSVTSSTAGLQIDWYNVPTGGTPLITSPDYTTPPLTTTTTYYVQASANGCISSRTAVTVTVSSQQQAPTAGGATICSGTSATLTASGSGGTYNWYNSPSSQKPLGTGATFQTPVLTASTTFYVESASGTCKSSRTAVTVTVNNAVPAPSAAGQIVCSGSSATLTATAQNGSFEWYDAATGGTLLASAATYTTPPITTTTTYYVQSVSSGCASPRTAVQVSVMAAPLAPAATGATICSGNTATIAATTPGGSYQWYDSATGGTLLASTQAYTTPALTATTTYYVQNISTNGCASPRTAVTITVTPNPTQPTASGTTICGGTTASLSANASGGTIEWYDAANGGNKVATGSNFTTPALSVTTTYYVQNTSGQCSSPRTAVTVNVTNVPNPEFQYSSGTFCPSGPNPTPVINNPAGGTFSASPAGLVINPNTGQINLSASTLGNYTVSFASNGTCANVTTAQIAIATVPNAQFSYAGPYCQDGTNPLPTYPAGPNPGVFSAAPAGLVFVNTSTGEINLAKSTPGTYTVTNSIAASGSCPASTATNTVTISQAAAVNAGADQTVGTGTKVQLAGSFSGASGVIWSGGAGSFSNSSSPTAIYTPAAGETSVTLTLTTVNSAAPCGPKSSKVTIAIGNPPSSPTASGTTVCAGSQATLVATAPGGTYQWYDAPTGGNLLSTGAVYTTQPLSATTLYYVQTTVNGIPGNRTQVTATVNAVPVAPTAANDTVCMGNTATLLASGSTGTYEWYDAAAGGNLLSTTNKFVTPSLIASTSYYVQTTVNGCISGRTQVNVIVNAVPSITSATTQSICSGNPLGYTITSDIPATYTWSRAAVPGISNAPANNQTGSSINETLINTTDTAINVTYVLTPNSNKCMGSPVNLVVTVYPAIIVTSAKNLAICNGTSTDYAIKFSYPPDSFSWSRAQVAGISNLPVSNQTAAVIREDLTNTTTKPVIVDYIFTINTSTCPVPAFDLAVMVNPTAHITSPASITLCSNTPLNYAITSDVDSVTYTWSRAAVAGISNPAKLNQTTAFITDTLINTTGGVIGVPYTVTPFKNGCSGAAITFTAVVVPPSPKPNANSNSPICINSTIKLNADLIQGATYSWVGPNGFTASVQAPTIPNATKANAGVYILTVNSNGCLSLPDSVNVSVDDLPLADAGPNLVACQSDSSIQLNGKISGGTTTGVWSSNGSGTFSPAANQLNAKYVFSAQDKTAGNVVLTLTSTSKDDCNFATSNTTVTFQPLPTADAGPNQDVCSQATSVQLNGKATNQSGVFWVSKGSGTFSPSANIANPLYFPSADEIKSGVDTLIFNATSTACSNATSQVTIRYIPPPIVSTGKIIYVIKGNPTVLTPFVSDKNVHYQWSPNLNINGDTLANPTITETQDITYTLKVTDVRGCVTEEQVLIKVLKEIAAPNAFTPNGDGINDTWNIPDLDKYPAVTVDIFTRYGQKIYHSDGYGIPWDGTSNGTQLPQGVYYYVISTRFKNEKVTGYVTILR